MKGLDENTIEQIRQEYLNNKDLDGLLNIALLKWKKFGTLATCNDYFPEICYYFGRKQDINKFTLFLQEYVAVLNLLPYETIEMGKELFNIGYRFPYLDDEDISFLEDLYQDSRMYFIMKYMMFDEERLPKKLDKYDISKINIKNYEFSEQLLSNIYKCFGLNEKIDETFNDCYVYNREINDILLKPYSQISLVEFYISETLSYTKCIEMCTEIFENNVEEHLQKVIKENYYGIIPPNIKIGPYELIRYLKKINSPEYNDVSKLNRLRRKISLNWLLKVNEKDIVL